MMTDPNAYYAGGLGVELYDLFTGGGLLTGDVEFYLDSARRFGGPILELGTGTGRVLIPLADAGHEVVGVDLSRPMLDRAAAKLRERPEPTSRVRLVEGDMTSFDLDQQFALALVPARSFQHVVTPEGQRLALNCIRRHLLPGGHLILDLFDPNFECCLETTARLRRDAKRSVPARAIWSAGRSSPATPTPFGRRSMKSFVSKNSMEQEMSWAPKKRLGRYAGTCGRKLPTCSNSPVSR